MEVNLKDAKQIFEDLLRCGAFYHSAIELDGYIKDPISGTEFGDRIVKLLHQIDSPPLIDPDKVIHKPPVMIRENKSKPE